MRIAQRLLVATATVVLMMLASAGLASAHVHGITPLLCLDQDSSNSGANVADDRAADPAADLFVGLIPANAGGNIGIGEGGFGTPACDVTP